jgi:selenocysteine lyase/cysteine desulfurase
MFTSKGGVIAFAFRPVPHNLAAKELAEKGGIGVRNGCFCAHLITKYLMHIHPFRSFIADLGMMLIPRFTQRVIPGIVRVSIGLENDADEVDRFLEIIREIKATQRSKLNSFLGSTYNGTPFIPTSPTKRLIERFIYDRIKKVFE